MDTIETTSGLMLEARWDEATDSEHAIVLCHPHPLHGGTMRAPLMHKVAKALVAMGVSVLRFNFRGVSASDGAWDDGVAEVDDVAAAVAAARSRHGAAVSLAGWSFGAATALKWQARDGDTMAYAGIAPPVSSELTPTLPEPNDLEAARRLFIVGDRDQFVTTDELTTYGVSIGAQVEVLSGSDHFFYFREEVVARLIGDFVTAS